MGETIVYTYQNFIERYLYHGEENVRLIHPRGWYNIFVEKEEFINEHLSTTELDEDIISTISQ